jgi:serine phosphatase RsbU (regulator of sigma subunit)
MRVLRSVARAYALEGGGPARVLARLDGFMARQDQDEMATVWHGQYRPGTGELTYGSAGHPPPVLHTHDQGVVLLAPADAPPLGSGAAHDLAQERTFVLAPGAVLVAYSDGLVERRGTDFDDQLEILTAIVGRASDPARTGGPAEIAARSSPRWSRCRTGPRTTCACSSRPLTALPVSLAPGREPAPTCCPSTSSAARP